MLCLSSSLLFFVGSGGGCELARGARLQADPLQARHHHDVGDHAACHAVRQGLLSIGRLDRGPGRRQASSALAEHEQETPLEKKEKKKGHALLVLSMMILRRFS